MATQLDLNAKIDLLIVKVSNLEEKMATKKDLAKLDKKVTRLEGKIDYIDGGLKTLLKMTEDEGDLTDKRLQRVEDKLNLPAIS